MDIFRSTQIDVSEFSYLRLIREFLTRISALIEDWKALNNLIGGIINNLKHQW